MKKYKIKYQNGKKIEEIYLETVNISNEKLPNNIIEIKEIKHKFSLDFINQKNISDKELLLIFYELELMLDSKINISDALEFLIKNKSKKSTLEFLKLFKYSLSNGKSIVENLNGFKINDLVISFLKISQDNGNIALNIKTLSSLLQENYEIKKGFIKSLTYPIVLFISFFSSLIIIFNLVIPKFEVIFSQIKNELPFSTKVLLEVNYIFENYAFYFLGTTLFLFVIFVYFYKRNLFFRGIIEKLLVDKIPLVSDIYKYMQLYKLFLVMDIMLKSNYEFHKALISSKILLKNKYLLDKIYIIDNLLQNGNSINDSFLKTKLFDDVILNLINTAEISNNMNIVINEIKEICKNRFYGKIDLLISLIQPIFLILISGLILWVVLGIFLPIWDMGNLNNF